MEYQLALAVAAMLVMTSQAFPNGARNNASNPMESLSSFCVSGHSRPNHGDIFPQTSFPPYTVTVSSPSGAVYSPNRKVRVTIRANTPEDKFKGFLIYGDNTKMSFAGDITCTKGHVVKFCNAKVVTHNLPTLKREIVCHWTPPDYQIGTVRFIVTVVKNFTHFWTDIPSQSVKGDPATMTYEQKTKLMQQEMMRNANNMFGGASSLFGGGAATGGLGGGGANAFTAILKQLGAQGQGQAAQQPTNLWGIPQQSQQSQQGLGFDSKSLLSMFGGGGEASETSRTSPMRGGNKQFSQFSSFFGGQ